MAGRGSFQSFLRVFCHLPLGGALLTAGADASHTVESFSSLSGFSLPSWFSAPSPYILEVVQAVFRVQASTEALESHFPAVNVNPVNTLAQTADFFFDLYALYSGGFLHIILQYVLVLLFQAF